MRAMATLCFWFSLVSLACGLSCLDESGKAVNWWFLAKHPVPDAKHGNDQGTGYVYITSDSSAATMQPGRKLVTDPTSLLGQELAGIYGGSVKNYLFYNDQLPNGSWTEVYGHSKGYLGWDDSTAFWVQHSIPHFPNFVAKGYLYGQGQEKFGQHAFCMTMSKANVDEAAGIMKYSNGWIYEHKTDGSLQNVEDIIKGNVAKTGSKIQDVAMPWGTVRLFGKTVAVEENILQAVITPNLKQSVLSQSWLNGGHPFGSFCPPSGYDVLDIQFVKWGDEKHDTHLDHSKWAVAKDPSSLWACGLDNNHVRSQLKRSGLAACMENKVLSTALRAAADTVAPCGSPTPTPTPPPPPHTPCCYSHNTTCNKGMTCCSLKGSAYASQYTCMRYGSKHHCIWTNSTCLVGDGQMEDKHDLPSIIVA